MAKTKRIEITLTADAARRAGAALARRGLLSAEGARAFAGPVFDVSKPKPGEAMTNHTINCESDGNNVLVEVKYWDADGNHTDTDMYLYPLHQVARVKVTE